MSPVSLEGGVASPLLLDRLGPHILRSQISTAQYKAIPNNSGTRPVPASNKGTRPSLGMGKHAQTRFARRKVAVVRFD